MDYELRFHEVVVATVLLMRGVFECGVDDRSELDRDGDEGGKSVWAGRGENYVRLCC